ncbi:hypothetical protein L1987_12817 [Smallanthus sonchifolius]|uniref:Uncharacterized protein n=1 Tax=Smallanthus sonchifolius TaxID=185202 RepID=A0ACB9JGW9_9ASTR|nr:hypothetical protein L1987_12817 [Smallanthus sonchifolius]
MASTTFGISSTPLVSNIIVKRSPKSARPPTRNRLTLVKAQAGNDSSVDVQVSNNQNKGGNTAHSSVERRPSSTISPFGLLDPLSPMRTMRQMLDTMDKMFDDSMALPMRNHSGWNIRSPWDIQDDENEIKMRFDVPGLSKEDLKVFVEDNMLVIKGEHKQDKIKADLKYGVLLISIPKMKVERKHILIEEIPNLPELEETLDLAHLTHKVFVNMKKRHSRSQFSGIFIESFDTMLGFSDGESPSSTHSSEEAYDDENDGDDNEQQNVEIPQVVADKGKAIMTEEDIHIPQIHDDVENIDVDKELEEEYSRRNLLEIQSCLFG